MSLYRRRVFELGIEPLPPFVREVCLHLSPSTFLADTGPVRKGLDTGPMAVYCLVLWDQSAMRVLSSTFWSHRSDAGVPYILGQSRLAVPLGSQWFTVSMPNPELLVGWYETIFPEDFFRLQCWLAV